MNEVIPIEGKKKPGASDIYEDLETKLRDIYTVADLLSEVDTHLVDCNAAGYCLTRMIEEAQELHKEYWKLQKGGAK